MPDVDPEGRLYIDGEFREAVSGARFEVWNPADETLVGTAADAQAEDVSAAVTAARRAADETSWRTDHAFRARVLRQLQEGLRKEAATAKQLQIAEAGTPSSGIGGHIDVMTEDMSYFNDLIERFPWETDFGVHHGLNLPSNRRVRYEPYGVVGAITPWNAPFMTDIWKIQHALATGNTIVLKTAPDTPLTGALIARVAQEHTELPPGVLNIISSRDKAAAGEALTGDPRVDMYHFTGYPRSASASTSGPRWASARSASSWAASRRTSFSCLPHLAQLHVDLLADEDAEHQEREIVRLLLNFANHRSSFL